MNGGSLGAFRTVVGILTTTAALAIVVEAQDALTNGLVGYWQFDEGAGTTAHDASVSANTSNFRIVNAAQGVYGAGVQHYSLSPTWAAGMHGSALSLLSSSSYPGPLTVVLDPNYGITCTWYQTVDIGVETSLVVNACSNVTVACWVRPTSFAGATASYYAWKTSTSMNVIGFADYGCAIYGPAPYPYPPSGSVDKVLSIDSSGKPRFNVLVSSNLYTTPVPTTAVPLNTWTHLCATYDGNAATVWMNGVSVSSTNGLVGPSCTSYRNPNIHIGGGLNNFDYATFDGLLDNARVYSRALSASEVALLYSRELKGSDLPWAASASAVLVGGFVVDANILDRGSGYTNVPPVWIEGGGGTGAQATAVVDNGFVVGITITDAGVGYSSTPLVIIAPPSLVNPVLDIAPMSLLTFSNVTLGGVYQLQKSVGRHWENVTVSFTATNVIYTQMVSDVVASDKYRLALSPVPTQAFASARVVNKFVVSATVTSGGSGYITNPAVVIVGGGGTNATAVAQIFHGVLTNIVITSAGKGYTNTPRVEIAEPPTAAVLPAVQPVMRLDSGYLEPQSRYRIQFKSDLGGAWADWNGGMFNTTDVTNSQYLFVTNGMGLFRLHQVP